MPVSSIRFTAASSATTIFPASALISSLPRKLQPHRAARVVEFDDVAGRPLREVADGVVGGVLHAGAHLEAAHEEVLARRRQVERVEAGAGRPVADVIDRKSTRLNSSHRCISY